AGVANAHINLADLEYEEGDQERARAHWEASLRLCRQMGEKRSAAFGLMGLASLALAADPTPIGGQRAARLGGAAAGLLAAGCKGISAVRVSAALGRWDVTVAPDNQPERNRILP